MVTAVILFSLWWHCGGTVVIVVALRFYWGPCGDIVVIWRHIVVTVVVLRFWVLCESRWHCGGTVITVVVLRSLWCYCGHFGADVMILCSLWLQPTRSWI